MSFLTALLVLVIIGAVVFPWFQRRREQQIVALESKIIKLLAVNQDKEMYALDIIRHLEMSFPDVYVYEALERLQRKSLVCVHTKKSEHGILRNLYLITGAGVRAACG